MTPDKLILGVTEGDETVLSYLDSLSDAQLEALFAPMFNVTRPLKSLKEKIGQAKIMGKIGRTRSVQKKDLMSEAQKKLAAMTPEKRALLAEFGL